MLEDPNRNPIEINEIVFHGTGNESSNWKCVKNVYSVFLHSQMKRNTFPKFTKV